ncbi:MAG: hypothetical protein H0U10_17530, partial [Chloroflexia bacterium]|nr:hypothetical protein [Chloroflexia bacterium]
MQDSVATVARTPLGSDGRAGWAEVGDDTPDPVEDHPIAETALTAALPPLLPELFINRELSWLEFNRRVLEEARDARAPLLERAKFAAIFASNLNEFFMIRVAGVIRKIEAGVGDPGPDGRTATQSLAAIRDLTQELLDDHAAMLRHELLPKLAEAGVHVVDYDRLDAAARHQLADRFDRGIFPILTPQAIDRGRRFPHVSNRSINLIVSLRLPVGARFARLKIPATLPRLVPIATPPSDAASPPRLRFTLLE